MSNERKFKNLQSVVIPYVKLTMIVVDAIKCVKGWRYKLAFPKKDGTPNLAMQNRYFFEDELLNGQ